jgi:hypothetical protein
LLFTALAPARAAVAACSPSATALCLNAGRFRVEVNWKDFQSRTGQGQAVPLTADTGHFWFFTDSNIELVVKVLDARAVNGKYWVFFGALSNVEYTLKVTDTTNGSVKNYQNPSGQFASVGDTSAFPGTAGAVTTQESVIVAGDTAAPSSVADIQKFIDSAPGTSAFTPCPETTFGFNLNGCRFHIEVKWDDGRGGTGNGQPVQLTNDTGYFWFFSPANVELMVKVLDARPVNGKFWVFFGALSNVKYSITVKDSVTGSYKKYENPSGTFASIGDTGAFRGGYSVVSVPDPGHAGSANLDDKGGRVTATGADGTLFTLEVPPQALWSPETVTLTPVSHIDRFPFSGGLVAGVEIEPEGLVLSVGATLTIQPVSPPPLDRTLPYSYSKGGEDFILHPRDPDTPSLRLPVFRFGGYGAGQGTPGEAASRLERMPTGPLSPYLQRYAYELLLRVLGQISQAELAHRGTEIYREAFEQVVAPLLGLPPASGVRDVNRKEEHCDLGDDDLSKGIAILIGIIQQKQKLGVVNDETGEVDTGLEAVLEFLRACLKESFNQCKTFNDPFETLRMIAIARQLQLLGEEDLDLTTYAEGGLIERCLRFELDFESRLVAEYLVPSRGVTATRLKYRAHVPLRFNWTGNLAKSVWEGECSLLPEFAELELPYSPAEAKCKVTIDPGNSRFTAATAWISFSEDLNLVKLLYDPGDPTVETKLICEDKDPVPLPVFQFAVDYGTFHQNEGNGLYLAKDWQLQPLPSEYLAIKSYERTIPAGVPVGDAILTEETWFFLKHTPDAPMPECPQSVRRRFGAAANADEQRVPEEP